MRSASASQPIPEAALEIVGSTGTRRFVRLSQSPFLIGRTAEAGNHLELTDVRISRQCAALVYDDGVFRLEDRGQRQGVFVNGQKIDSRPLEDGDTITFAAADSFRLIFHDKEPEEALPELLSRMEQASTLASGARDLRHLSLLLEATALLQSHLPVEEILGAMVDRAMALTNADRGLLLEADPEAGLRPLLARQRGGEDLSAEGLAPSQTAIAHALEEQRSVMEVDISRATADLRQARSIVAQRLRSVIAIPLLSRIQPRLGDASYVPAPARLLGLLYLDSRQTAAFSRLERRILDMLALEASSVLDKARLVKKEREQLRLEQELSTARQIQQALLPKNFHNIPHLQVTGVNRPCLAVGGDYFDVMELSTERTAFVISDVCGKGLGAALLTAMLQGTFSAMTLGQEPARVCAHLNRFMCSHSEVQRHATLFFGILDASGRLEFINAGHPPPILVRAGRAKSVFPAECFPLGLFSEAEFKTASTKLECGDTLVLFTDGINEAVNPQGERFGFDRLREVVGARAASGIKELQADVLAALEDFTEGSPQADDLTLLVIRYA